MPPPYVVDKDTIIVEKGKGLPVKPGQPIRFVVEVKGRFEPLEKKWLGERPINAPEIHVDDTVPHIRKIKF